MSRFTPEGLNLKRLDDMRADVEARLRRPPPDGWGPDADVGPDTAAGQFIAAILPEIAEQTSLLGEIVAAGDPDTAVGVWQKRLCSMVGVFPRGKSPATGTVRLSGKVGTVIPGRDTSAPKQVRAPATGRVFEIALSATLTDKAGSWLTVEAAAGATSITTNGDAYDNGFRNQDIITIGATGHEFRRIVSLSGGVIQLDAPLASTWIVNTQIHAGWVEAQVVAVVDGLDGGEILADTVTEIVTPVTDWVAVTNPAALLPGEDEESPAELAARRRASVKRNVANGDPRIRRAVTAVPGVAGCLVLSNRKDEVTIEPTPDDPSRPDQPGHSVHIVVWPNTITDTTKDAVGRAIFRSAPAGIKTWAPDDGNRVQRRVADRYGGLQLITFAFPAQVNLWVTVRRTLADGADGDATDADITAAVLALLTKITEPGSSVYLLDYLNAAAKAAGTRVTAMDVLFGTGAGPTPLMLPQWILHPEMWEILVGSEERISVEEMP